jgi:uncharacterized protein (TIGR02145 family)
VSTQAVTNKDIVAGTATFNGTILTAGNLEITERGFVYATTTSPTLDDSKVIATGTDVGAFNVDTTGFAEGNIYYVRAYATNSKGTVYGNEVSVDFNVVMPTVSTQAVTNKNIATGTATFNGTIESAGDPAYTERGFVHATTANPTLGNSKVIATGTDVGAFNANVTGFTEGSTHHVRAYATNSKGTVYGEDIEFTFISTMPTVSTQAVTNTNISAGTATFNGTILTLGDPTYTERGFVYATIANPTLDDSKVIATGTGTGAFNANVTGLTEGSTYHVRAYATNSNGTVYGDNVAFAFIATLPTLSTQAVTNRNVVAGTATFNGTILTVGDPACTERGFAYGTSRKPTVDATKVVASGNTEGTFSSDVTGLTEDNVYYIRAYATNSKGTVYGEEVSVDFNVIMPTVSTQAVTNENIVAGTATFNGTILTLGDLAYTERGFVYGTLRNPTTDATKITVSGSTVGAFSSVVTGLAEYHVYYVRAYVVNRKGTVYGEEVSLDFSNCGVDFTDSRDNQVYPTVRIGTQCWMSKNMNIGTRVDGTNYTTHQTSGIQKICDNNDESKCTTYGGLYNWNETVNGENSGSIKYVSGSSTMIQGICPDAWHVPSDEEFKTLEKYLGMTQAQADGEGYRGTDEGRELKSTSSLWTYYSSSTSGTNSSGWSGLPGGYRDYSGGTFGYVGTYGTWWSSSGSSSSYAWGRFLLYFEARVYRYTYFKSFGFSVRCLLGN